jgi:hypothetical protein
MQVSRQMRAVEVIWESDTRFADSSQLVAALGNNLIIVIRMCVWKFFGLGSGGFGCHSALRDQFSGLYVSNLRLWHE